MKNLKFLFLSLVTFAHLSENMLAPKWFSCCTDDDVEVPAPQGDGKPQDSYFQAAVFDEILKSIEESINHSAIKNIISTCTRSLGLANSTVIIQKMAKSIESDPMIIAGFYTIIESTNTVNAEEIEELTAGTNEKYHPKLTYPILLIILKKISQHQGKGRNKARIHDKQIKAITKALMYALKEICSNNNPTYTIADSERAENDLLYIKSILMNNNARDRFSSLISDISTLQSE